MQMNNAANAWNQMATLTLSKCRQKCHSLGSCCDVAYCAMASEYAMEIGIALVETGNTIPFLDDDGNCVVSPHCRPLCSLHQCDIANLGFSPGDTQWTLQYFTLREQLNELSAAAAVEAETKQETSDG